MGPISAFGRFAIGVGTFAIICVFAGLRSALVVLGALSTLICCFSIVTLILNRHIRYLDAKEQRRCVYYILATIIPTIYVLTHLKEAAWEIFPF